MSKLGDVLHLVVVSALYLILPLVGWGLDDVAGFLSDPSRLVYALLVALQTAPSVYQALVIPGGIGTRGEAEKLDRRQALAYPLLLAAAVAMFVGLPFADRRGILVLGDDAPPRYAGLALYLVGGTLAFWSTLVLGRQYSTQVTIQTDHRLITSGPYRLLRHPRYLGVLLGAVGFALVFRAWAVALVGLALLGFFLWRISGEEALLRREFGADWDAYSSRTWRLIPLVY